MLQVISIQWQKLINHRFRLGNSFQEILCMIDVWINNESGWNVESIESQYINISTYRPLSGSSYMDLTVELKSPREGLINIKNKDQKNFSWCHVRHINPSKEHPERIKKIDKKLVKHITNPEKIRDEDKEFNNDLDYNEIEFLVLEKDFSKIEVKNNISTYYLVMKMAWVFKFIFQIKNLKTLWICCI